MKFGGACGDWGPSCTRMNKSGNQDMLSVSRDMHGTEHGSTNMISLIFHLMDMEIVGHFLAGC